MNINNLLELLSDKNQVEEIVKTNDKTQMYGLVITKEDAQMLANERKESLKKQQRVEFKESILPKIIYTFCDSPYIYQDNYAETIAGLQEIFYLYKNETFDTLTDDELLNIMKEAFDGECNGSLDYLQDTVLDRLARDIRKPDR